MEIPDVPKPLLEALTQAAGGERCAVVGGVVRDLLLYYHHNQEWPGLRDLDLVVEGNASEMVDRLKQALEDKFLSDVPMKVHRHPVYGTVDIELHLPLPFNRQFLIDIASARSEEYLVAADNPIVSLSSLECDLSRRDFTINAMAIDLASLLLIDPYKGQLDLYRKELRFLHSDSLLEDPTRLVRAAHYCARLNFTLSKDSISQVSNVIQSWPWDWKPTGCVNTTPPSLGTRLKKELEKLLDHDSWPEALGLLRNWKALKLFDADLQSNQHLVRRIRRANKHFKLPSVLGFVANASDPERLAFRLDLPRKHIKLLSKMLELEKLLELKQITNSILLPSHACALIEPICSDPQIAALLSIRTNKYNKIILPWFYRWRKVKSPVSASELISATRRKTGPWISETMTQMRYKEIDLRYLIARKPE